MKKLLFLMGIICQAQTPNYNYFGIFTTGVSGALNATISPTDTSIYLRNGSCTEYYTNTPCTTAFLSNMLIQIDNEVLQVCAVNAGAGNTTKLTIGHASCPNVDGRAWGAIDTFPGSIATIHYANSKAVSTFQSYSYNAILDSLGGGSSSGCSPTIPNGTILISNGSSGCISAFLSVSVTPSTNTGANNNVIGLLALTNNTSGHDNTVFGNGSLGNNSTGSNNVAIGVNAMPGGQNAQSTVGIGTSTCAGSGVNDVCIGTNAGLSRISGEDNTFIGARSGGSNNIGDRNIAIGAEAFGGGFMGSHNVAIGFEAGLASNGSNNVFIGDNAGAQDDSGSNKLYIDNTNTTSPLIGGDFLARTVFFAARVGATLHTPASSSEACTTGQFTDDASFHYVCTSTNTWKRIALSSF